MVNISPFKISSDSRREIMDLARKVLDYPVEQVYTGHCNSARAMAMLKDVMGDRLAELSTGFIFEI